MTRKKQRLITFGRLILWLAAHKIERPELLALKLIQAEKKINRLDCKLCNGEIDEDKGHDLICKVLDDCKKLAAENDRLAFYHQGDPRGCSLYVYNFIESLKTGRQIHSTYYQIGFPLSINL